MPVFNLFSFRKNKHEKDNPDIYQYDEIPDKLRVQIVQIVRSTIGQKRSDLAYYSLESTPSEKAYNEIHKILCKEYGVFSLSKREKDTDFEAVYNYFLTTKSVEECLDIIELTFRAIDKYIRSRQYDFNNREGTTQDADDAIKELNERFRRACVGYEFISGEIIRIDSNYIHSEIVKPALLFLENNNKFDGSRDEFLSAHSHYRNKKYKETLVDCLKSFESLLKSICEKNNWNFNKNDAAKKLINICISNDLIPQHMQVQFSNFRALLESGVPTIRNKEGGHGQGSEIKKVSEAMASYALHLTATNIVFLAENDKNLNG